MSRSRWIALGCLTAFLLVCGFCGDLFWGLFGHIYRLVAAQRALPGEPEAAVYARLGKPTFVLRPSDLKGRPLDFPWRGMSFSPVPVRKITGKVLLYQRLDRAAYVFVSPEGRVEAVELAGT